MTTSYDTRSPLAPAADQLRWQVSPVLFVILDAANQVVTEVLGQRAVVPDARDLAEAAREARVAQYGSSRPAETALLAAEIAELAARQRYDAIRQHILAAATRQLGPEYARDITADAMTGITAVLTQAVTSAAGEAVRGLAADPAWREILGVRVLDAYRDRTGHVEMLLREIAGMTLTAGCDSPRCGECGQDPVNATVLDELIARARNLTGHAPEPATGTPLPEPAPDPVPAPLSLPLPAPAPPALPATVPAAVTVPDSVPAGPDAG